IPGLVCSSLQPCEHTAMGSGRSARASPARRWHFRESVVHSIRRRTPFPGGRANGFHSPVQWRYVMRHLAAPGRIILAGLILTAPAPARAQEVRAALPGVITAADYERAEGMLGSATRDLVIGGSVRAAWLSDGRFWFRTTTTDGTEFVLVDPERRTRSAAFDQVAVAREIGRASCRERGVMAVFGVVSSRRKN